MRNGQNKRMRGRNRNKGHHGGHHHQHHHNPLSRVYESNGPEVKIRGTPHHVVEKYLQLARDATASGDHVTAENYHQHAEHYFRLIAAAQEQLRQQNPYYQPQQMPNAQDNADGGFDDGDDDQPNQGQPQQGQPQQGQPQQGQPQQFNQQHYGNQQREQPQPYQQQQPYQNRPQHQQYQPQPQQQSHYPQQQQQQHQQPQQQQPSNFASNEGLPSFITGAQPQPQPATQGNQQNGYDNQGGGDRYPRHRRRRHRGGPRPDMQPQQDFRGDDAPEPGNS